MKKNKFINQCRKALIKNYGIGSGVAIYDSALKRLNELCLENADEPKAMYMHTRERIYPSIALLDAQIKHGAKRVDALKFMSDFVEWRTNKMAKVVKLLLKIPFIYKKMPSLFTKMTKKNFGTAARFDAIFYETPKSEMRFDMIKCPYFDLFKKYGYIEMTKAFCRADDILYGNMHPNLVWNRTKTIGDGDKVCDFNIFIKKSD